MDAAQSIMAKLFYQMGFECPLFLTLVFLTGQALLLIPNLAWKKCHSGDADHNDKVKTIMEDHNHDIVTLHDMKSKHD